LKVGEGDSFRARTAAHLDDANKADEMIESFQEMESSLSKERQRELSQHLEDIIMDKYELDDKIFTTSKGTGGPLEHTLEPWELAMDLEPVAEWYGSKYIEDIFREAKRRMGIEEAATPVGKPVVDDAYESALDAMEAADDAIPITGLPDQTLVYLTGLNDPVRISQLSHADLVPTSLLENQKFSAALFEDMVIDPEIGKDLKRYLSSFIKKDVKNQLKAAAIWYTDMFKQFATIVWPAFHGRNDISGFINSMYGGAFDPDQVGPMRWIMPYINAGKLRFGNAIKGLANTDHFKNMDISDEAAAQAMLDGVVGKGLLGPKHNISDVAGPVAESTGVFSSPRGSVVPAIHQAGDMAQPNVRLRDRLAEAIVMSEEEIGTNIPVVSRIPGSKTFFRTLERAKGLGHQLASEQEYYLRVAPVIAYLQRGMSLSDAITKVKLTQVDYNALSSMEKHYLRRIIPFYTFTRRQIPFVLEELSNPSSGMSTMIKGVARGKRAGEDPNEPTPDWLSTGISIPLGKTEAGLSRYLTNMGGFLGGPEDVLSLLKPGHGPMETVGRTLSGLGARANPIGQQFFEMTAQRSLFYQRPFSELKSPTARLIGQLSDSEQMPKYPSMQLDALLSRIPGYSRLVSSARTLTDSTRRPIRSEDGSVNVGNVLARTLPFAMGMRYTDTDLAASRNKVLQGRIEELLARNPNVSKFSKMYVPESRLGALSPEELEAYLLYKKLGSEASKASYARRKAAEYSN